MSKRLWIRLSTAILGGSALAATAVAAPALGLVASNSVPVSPPESPPATAKVTINQRAQLLDNGASVKVTATVTCGPGDPTSRDLFIDVAEEGRGGRVAYGFGHDSQFTCDGAAHGVDVVVPAESRHFRSGYPVVLARLEAAFAGDFRQRGTAGVVVKARSDDSHHDSHHGRS